MKVFISVLTLAFVASGPLAAEGLYFDIGLGIGAPKTTFDGNDVSSGMPSSVKETGVDLGLKLGWGPFGDVPLYVVGELGGMGHRLEDSSGYIQYNTYLVGPGIVYYPIPLIQLAGSVGYSYINNTSDFGLVFDTSKGGLAESVSAAFDWGDGDNGLLLGLRLFHASNTLETTGVSEDSTLIGAFLRYTYRQKVSQK